MEIIKYKTPTGFRYHFVAWTGYQIRVPIRIDRYSKIDYDTSTLKFRCAFRRTIDKCMIYEYGARIMVNYRQAIDSGVLDRMVVKKISDEAKLKFGSNYLQESKEGIEFIEQKYQELTEK